MIKSEDFQTLKDWLKDYNFKELPQLGRRWFVVNPAAPVPYLTLYHFKKIDISFPIQSSEKEIYGWAVEFSYDGKTWHNTKKLYANSGVATHSIIQMEICNFSKTKYRILPLFKFNQDEWRAYQISELLYQKK